MIELLGADYAEYFEWAYKNINNEDRIGYFVALIDGQVEIATSSDYILGIVSITPSMVGCFHDNSKFYAFLVDDLDRQITT